MALILILEDDEVIRGQLARMLKDKGHNVEEAADVKEFDIDYKQNSLLHKFII